MEKQNQLMGKRGRPKKDNSILPGQTSLLNGQQSEAVSQKLELITKNKITDIAGLKKAIKEHKFLDGEIKTEISNLTAIIKETERPVMERVNDMRIKSTELLNNITEFAKDHAEDLFVAVPDLGKVLDLGNYDVIIKNKTTISIKPKTSTSPDAGVESENINHGS